MSKGMSLFFSALSIVFLAAMAVSIAHSWLWTIIFLLLSIITTGIGFMYKAKLRKKNSTN